MGKIGCCEFTGSVARQSWNSPQWEEEDHSTWWHKAWVTCQLEFKERKQQIFSPGSYSELFFLDEVTAFAAGHRPCAECRRDRYNEFKAAWLAMNLPGSSVPIAYIDKQLHAERAARGGVKITYTDKFNNLPLGTFIERKGNAYLLWQDEFKKWFPMVTRNQRHCPPQVRSSRC